MVKSELEELKKLHEELKESNEARIKEIKTLLNLYLQT